MQFQLKKGDKLSCEIVVAGKPEDPNYLQYSCTVPGDAFVSLDDIELSNVKASVSGNRPPMAHFKAEKNLVCSVSEKEYRAPSWFIWREMVCK